jgi:glycosyltransferase involved in cell wall biosynthesis
MGTSNTILITCSRLVELAGAEVTTLELAEAFARMGWTVSVAAFELGDDMRACLDAAQASYFDMTDEDCFSDVHAFDVVWLHHYVTANRVLLDQRLRARRVVFSSLSWFEPMEAPPLSSFRVSHYLVNSDESLSRFVAHYPDVHAPVSVFHNSVTRSAWPDTPKLHAEHLQRLAIVSNHPPAEVKALVGILADRHVAVDVFGVDARRERVTPELIAGYDAVLTIGKTVQYCIAGEVPVYCYDHFGGDGWVLPANFDRGRQHNFSGRAGRGRVDAATLATELLDGYASATAATAVLKAMGRSHFVLEDNIVGVLTALERDHAMRGLSGTDQRILARQTALYSNQRAILANAQVALAAREQTIECLRAELEGRDREVAERDRALESREREIERRDAELARLQKSYSWRVTRPLRSGARSVIRGRDALGVHLSWVRFLLGRSHAVIRHQGPRAFLARASRYAHATARRQLAALRTRRRMRNEAVGDEAASPVLVSFVIPVYDRTDVLKTAIESALNQTIADLEVLIVTDGSPAETLEVVNTFAAEPRVKIFNYPRSSGNAVRGRNKGIAEARGRYIAFLDSDDVAMPDRLERCLPLLERGEADVVYGAWEAIVDGSREVAGIVDGQVTLSPHADLPMLLDACIPCQSTVMVRKSLFEAAGLLKPTMQYREDHELWARLAHWDAVFRSLPVVLTRLRLHSGNNELNFKMHDDHWRKRVDAEYQLAGPKPKKIAFVLPGVGIGGGIAVVLQHAALLMQAGHDAFVINVGEPGDGSWFPDNPVPVVQVSDARSYIFDGIDLLIATGWSTVDWLDRIPADRKLYFVQSDERRFYDEPALKKRVHETYTTRCEYLTEARWIQKMLHEEFGHDAAYVPNGIDGERFYQDVPLAPKPRGRLRVLLEGPILIPFKGMQDSYAAVSGLDCELWIVSSAGNPPPDWKYDRFFGAVPFGEMCSIYSSCDIFLKMSRVEGFFGPPMEAMACGCAVVVGKVSGHDEYIVNGVNALVVEQGDVPGARRAVERLLADDVLRRRLIRGGRETVPHWSWARSADAMLNVINGDAGSGQGAWSEVPTSALSIARSA